MNPISVLGVSVTKLILPLCYDSVEKMRDCFIIQKLFAHCNKSISYRKDCSSGDPSADQSDSSIHWRTGRDRNDC
jgi:hypothetical protein